IFALVGNHLEIREFMAVGLLPIVILTMIIERFFIVIEEAGAAQGFETAAGSAVVAAIIYGLIQWDSLQLTFFVYPELIFIVAACQVVLGRYTGLRLTELIRFRELGRRI
ncbi:MAG TPA: 7TM domain-containing protein, partial [Candidatus Binatia bacterium]